MRLKPLTEADYANIECQLSAGILLKDLAPQFGRSISTMSRITRKMARPDGPWVLTKAEKDRALTLVLRERFLTGAVPPVCELTGREKRASAIRTLQVARCLRATGRLIDRCISNCGLENEHGCKPWTGSTRERHGQRVPMVYGPDRKTPLDPRRVLLSLQGRVGKTRARIRYTCSGLGGFCMSTEHMKLKGDD